ncbi:MAG TPA: DUF4160 domain-containing protein [Gemmatimonadaceae bacterium]|nr:DUF4160 domain-containing protein [Gemmatimonadaceae bacterium]
MAYPQDHLRRHVHAFIGSGEVIVDLRADGSVALADRTDAVFRVTPAEVRKVLKAAAAAFEKLAAAWEKMHNG